MIYFGQELGEKADGKEGFNQADDRTTMFDFWGVPSHQAWMNGGKFDGAGLTEEQKNLQAFYKGLLKFVNGSEAVQKGAFFDLQYIQGHDYDRRKVYSYLRYCENKSLWWFVILTISKKRTSTFIFLMALGRQWDWILKEIIP
jgi:hypothetical protein